MIVPDASTAEAVATEPTVNKTALAYVSAVFLWRVH